MERLQSFFLEALSDSQSFMQVRVLGREILLFGLSLPNTRTCINDCESDNAAIVFLGSIVGLTVIYAGASIGEGEAEEQNFFCAGVGAVGWFSLWIIMESFSRASTAINCDRDKASAT